MGRVEAIETEIQHLSRDELAVLREWFVNFDSEAWDRQLESDANAGRLDALAAKALDAHKRRESKEL